MNPRQSSVRLSAPSLGLIALLACALPAVTHAADQMADPATQRDQAVNQYVNGAKRQLDAYRSEINADANPAHRQALDQAKEKLAACDRLLDQLKAADQVRFDPVKADYERQRDDLIRSMPGKS